MTLATSLTVRGLDAAVKRARRRAAKMADQTPAYKRCAVFLDQWWQQNFKTDGGKTKAGAWAPLSDVTKRSKKRSGKTKMMYVTGFLKRSLDKGSGSNRKSAWIRTNVEYAAEHQHGTGGKPQRQLIPFKADVQADVRRIFADWVKVAIHD